MSARKKNQHDHIHSVGCELGTAFFTGSLIRRRCKSDEPSLHAEAVDLRGRAGLTKRCDWQRVKFGSFGCAITHRPAHPIENDCPMSFVNRNIRLQIWSESPGGRGARRESMPAVYQGCVGVNKLNGRRLEVVAFTHGALGTPCTAHKFARGFLAPIDAAFSAKPKIFKCRIDARFIHAFAHFPEIVITGVGNRFSRVQRRQIARMGTGGVKLIVIKCFVANLLGILVEAA